MAIKTSTFGGITLTGKAARAFEKQFLRPTSEPNMLAQKLLEEGREILKQLQEKGYAVVRPAKKD